jgi:hypothetical protein
LKKTVGLILLLLLVLSASIRAQDEAFAAQDTISLPEGQTIAGDTLNVGALAASLDSVRVFKPNSKKAVIMSAIFPGLGQIYNRKYWKLPLVYGSFIGCAYAITWNGSQYNGYRQAYLDFIDDKPESESWKNYMPPSLPDNFENWSGEQVTWFQNALKSRKDYYRRYRDMSYLISVAVYAIWIIDAYVDAELFDFDVSPDLSMRIDPVLFQKTAFSAQSVGLSCSFNF